MVFLYPRQYLVEPSQISTKNIFPNEFHKASKMVVLSSPHKSSTSKILWIHHVPMPTLWHGRQNRWSYCKMLPYKLYNPPQNWFEDIHDYCSTQTQMCLEFTRCIMRGLKNWFGNFEEFSYLSFNILAKAYQDQSNWSGLIQHSIYRYKQTHDTSSKTMKHLTQETWMKGLTTKTAGNTSSLFGSIETTPT